MEGETFADSCAIAGASAGATVNADTGILQGGFGRLTGREIQSMARPKHRQNIPPISSVTLCAEITAPVPFRRRGQVVLSWVCDFRVAAPLGAPSAGFAGGFCANAWPAKHTRIKHAFLMALLPLGSGVGFEFSWVAPVAGLPLGNYTLSMLNLA